MTARLACAALLIASVAHAAPPPRPARIGPPPSTASYPSGTVTSTDVERAARRVLGDPTDLALTQRRSSLTGEHARFAQIAPDGTQVAGAEASVHFVGRAPSMRVGVVRSNLQRPLSLTGQRRMTAAEAGVFAAAASGGGTAIATDAMALPMTPGRPAELRAGWRVVIAQPPREWEVWVDGETGAAAVVRDLAFTVDGTGYVYRPNPLTTSGDTTLTDGGDADTPALTALREWVVIQGLDGTGRLRGDYVDAEGRFGPLTEPSLVYDYTRMQDEFEEVMAYYHVDRAQRHLQSLGFTGATAILDFPFHIVANAIAADNSFYSPTNVEIRLGRGGVDDGEDGDVIIHEYGHAVQDDIVPGWGSSLEAGAIGEGYSDLQAALVPTGSTIVVERACIAPWDAISFTPPPPPIGCLRRVDGEKHYPEHMHGQVHDDGEIYSGAMWDVIAETGLGDALGLQLLVEAHFSLAPDAGFADFVAALLAADAALHGGAHVAAMRRSLTWDGLLRDLTPPGTLTAPISSMPLSIASASPLGHEVDEQATVNVPGASALRLHFATFDMELDPSCLDGQCDNVYLYDAAGNLYAILSGPLGAFDSVVIPGDTVIVRWVTDVLVASPGFTIDRVDWSVAPVPDAAVPDANVATPDANVATPDATASPVDAALPLVDAATGDVGGATADAAPPGSDAAGSFPDAAAPLPDARAVDAAAQENAGDSGGCDCRASGRPRRSRAGAVALLLVVAIVFTSRRRRARR